MPDARARIVVLGSFVQACCWHAPHLPRPGETVLAPGFATEPAGKGLAVAVGCARLGAQVDLVLAIGRDAAGDDLLRLLDAEGVAATHVHRKNVHSGHGAGLIDANGENMIAVFRGANDALDSADVEAASTAIAGAGLVYGQWEAPPEAVAAAFAIARRHGVRTVLNPSPWQAMTPDLLRDTDVLVINQVEAGLLLECELPSEPEALLDAVARGREALAPRWNGAWLVMTLGQRGSVAFDATGGVVRAPACSVSVLNTLGAGDAFSAGLCTALAGGAGMADALRAGNACGAYAVGTPGILDGLPGPESRDRLLRPAA